MSLPLSDSAVLAALQSVVDPNTGPDFVSTEQLKNLKVEAGDVSFDVEPGYPAKSQIPALRKALIAAARGVAGVENVSANSTLVFAGMTMLLQNIVFPFIPLFFYILIAILTGLWLMPRHIPSETTISPGKWDLPARILIGTGFILLITGLAPYIGATLTGLLTTIPLYSSILAVFAHRHQGRAGASGVLRGLLLGLFSFAGFYIVLGLLIRDVSLFASFGWGTLTALLVQGTSLWILNLLHRK